MTGAPPARGSAPSAPPAAGDGEAARTGDGEGEATARAGVGEGEGEAAGRAGDGEAAGEGDGARGVVAAGDGDGVCALTRLATEVKTSTATLIGIRTRFICIPQLQVRVRPAWLPAVQAVPD